MFAGMTVCILGSLHKSAYDWSNIITENGGVIYNSNTSTLEATHIITTKEEVGLNSVPIKRAIEDTSVYILSEHFLEDCISQNSRVSEEPYNLRTHSVPNISSSDTDVSCVQKQEEATSTADLPTTDLSAHVGANEPLSEVTGGQQHIIHDVKENGINIEENTTQSENGSGITNQTQLSQPTENVSDSDDSSATLESSNQAVNALSIDPAINTISHVSLAVPMEIEENNDTAMDAIPNADVPITPDEKFIDNIKKNLQDITLQHLWPRREHILERVDYFVHNSLDSKDQLVILEFKSGRKLTRELFKIEIFNKTKSDLIDFTLLFGDEQSQKEYSLLFDDRDKALESYILLIRNWLIKKFHLKWVFLPELEGFKKFGSEKTREEYTSSEEYLKEFFALLETPKESDSNPPPDGNSFFGFGLRTFNKTYEQKIGDLIFKWKDQMGYNFLRSSSPLMKILQSSPVVSALLSKSFPVDVNDKNGEYLMWRGLFFLFLESAGHHTNFAFRDEVDEGLITEQNIHLYSPIVKEILSWKGGVEPLDGNSKEIGELKEKGECVSETQPGGNFLISILIEPFARGMCENPITIPGKLVVQPAGTNRLNTVCFVKGLVFACNSHIDSLLISDVPVSSEVEPQKEGEDQKCDAHITTVSLFGNSVDCLFLYKWNNIIHNEVVQIVYNVLQRKSIGEDLLFNYLFVKFNILQKLLDSLVVPKDQVGGNKVHLLLLANAFESTTIVDKIQMLLNKNGMGDVWAEWKKWVEETLQNLNVIATTTQYKPNY